VSPSNSYKTRLLTGSIVRGGGNYDRHGEGDSGRRLGRHSKAFLPRSDCEIQFCTGTFGAVELNRRAGADGKTAHALVTIGPAMVMIESEWPGGANRAPSPDGSSPVVLYVYVENVDETVARAEGAGAKTIMAPTNQFWGDRTAWIMDPSGHVWTVATRIEEATEEERKARLAEIHAKSTSSGG
jgi:PhnB protein